MMAISFEEAKKQWLAEIGGKSWEQLHDEQEAETDAKVKSLLTPEYIANWGKLPEGDE
jgi:hypothetical protein